MPLIKLKIKPAKHYYCQIAYTYLELFKKHFVHVFFSLMNSTKHLQSVDKLQIKLIRWSLIAAFEKPNL